MNAIETLQVESTHNGITYPHGTEVEVLQTTSYGVATVRVQSTGVIINVDLYELGLHTTAPDVQLGIANDC